MPNLSDIIKASEPTSQAIADLIASIESDLRSTHPGVDFLLERGGTPPAPSDGKDG